MPNTYHTLWHTPFAYKEQRTITFEDVDTLYIGKGNCCRCGCNGKYYDASEHPDEIESALKKFSSGKYNVQSHDKGKIFEIELNKETNQVYTLYLK